MGIGHVRYFFLDGVVDVGHRRPPPYWLIVTGRGLGRRCRDRAPVGGRGGQGRSGVLHATPRYVTAPRPVRHAFRFVRCRHPGTPRRLCRRSRRPQPHCEHRPQPPRRSLLRHDRRRPNRMVSRAVGGNHSILRHPSRPRRPRIPGVEVRVRIGIHRGPRIRISRSRTPRTGPPSAITWAVRLGVPDDFDVLSPLAELEGDLVRCVPIVKDHQHPIDATDPRPQDNGKACHRGRPSLPLTSGRYKADDVHNEGHIQFRPRSPQGHRRAPRAFRPAGSNGTEVTLSVRRGTARAGDRPEVIRSPGSFPWTSTAEASGVSARRIRSSPASRADTGACARCCSGLRTRRRLGR